MTVGFSSITLVSKHDVDGAMFARARRSYYRDTYECMRREYRRRSSTYDQCGAFHMDGALVRFVRVRLQGWCDQAVLIH